MNNKILCLLVCLLVQYSFAQVPYIEWDKTFGGQAYDILANVIQTTDGGYILGGYSSSEISGDKSENSRGFFDYWIIKIDENRQIQWQKTIGGNDEDKLQMIQQTADGGYILGGYSTSLASSEKTENVIGDLSNRKNDYWIIKLDINGTIQWQQTIGGDSEDVLSSIIQTKDGGYIVTGWSWSDISGDKNENNINTNGAHLSDYWIIKLDASGNIQWQNTIGGYNGEELYTIKQTSDGGYILGGSSASNISGDKNQNSVDNYFDYWAIKLNAQGNIQWQRTFGGSKDDRLTSVIQTKDGGYLLGGFSNSNSSIYKSENSKGFSDYWILKLDIQGNVQWQQTIGGNREDRLYSLLQTDDGNYILGGWSESDISYDKSENLKGIEDYWIIQLDSIGNTQWQKSIGGDYVNRFTNITPTNDGGYIVGGSSYSGLSGDKSEPNRGSNYADYWIVKLSFCEKKKIVNDTICSGQYYTLPSGKQVTISGTYIDTLKTVKNCDSIITTNLTVFQRSYQIIAKDFCIGQPFILSNGLIITSNGTYRDTIPNYCDSIIEYRIRFLNNVSTTQNVTICRGMSYTLPKGKTVTIAGIYRDTLQSSFGCDSVIINDISIYPNTFGIYLHTLDTIDAGSEIRLQPEYTSDSAVQWLWTPTERLSCTLCENPLASPIESILYKVTATAKNGCVDTATTQIIVRTTDVYIPTAFSPNNDGVNDNFTIFATNPTAFNLKIYNRWGQVIFESFDIQHTWNGTYQGEAVPMDSYVYTVEVVMPNGKHYHKQGIISVIK